MNNNINPVQLTATECEPIIALHVAISQRVTRIIRKFKRSQTIIPLPRSGRPRKLKARDRGRLRIILRNNRRATLQEIINIFPVEIVKIKMREEIKKMGLEAELQPRSRS